MSFELEYLLYALAALGALKIALPVVNALFFLMPFGGVNVSKLGKWAVVTGASDGIGAAYCDALASRGMSVVLISRSADKLQAAQAELQQKYPKVEFKVIAMDLGTLGESAVRERLMAQMPDSVGLLVNNVGISYEYPSKIGDEEFTDELVDKMIALNVTATTYMTKMLVPAMAEKKCGAVLNISSAAGVMTAGSPMLAMYAGTKAFVEHFTRSVATEYAADNLIIQTHAPYFVSTAMSKMRPSLICPKASVYARASVSSLGKGGPLVVPFWVHALQHFVMETAPAGFVANYVLGLHKDIRRRAIRKKNKAK